jgi:urea transport system permease protein
MNFLKASIQRYQLGSLLLLVLLLAVVLPLSLDIFRLNLVGKYLTYAFVAVGLVMVWGYGGVLSLGQGVFFGLGGYAMAMFLKLEASDPVSTKIQSTPGIPDFMDWNQITALPAFWLPFKSLPLTLILVVAVPMALAWLISFAMFKRRVGGVYFAIITQAVALILTVLIIGQQGYTGGVNGMTDLKTMLGCMIESSVLISAAAHLASLTDWLDLDGNVLITNDPFEGVRNLDGRITFDGVPERFGLQTSGRAGSHGLPLGRI